MTNKEKEKIKKPLKNTKPIKAKQNKVENLQQPAIKPVIQQTSKPVLYCVCKSIDESRPMILCEKCNDWFHQDCMGLEKYEKSQVEQSVFYCNQCARFAPKSGNFLIGKISNGKQNGHEKHKTLNG